MKFLYTILFILTNTLIGQEVFEGYTLFTPQAGNGSSGSTKLLNNAEQTIHTWTHSRGPASMPYLIQGDEPGLENTILVYPYRVPNPTMDSGGVGGGVQLVDWDGNVLWDYVLSNEQYQHHHDIQPMPNGNILILAWERHTETQSFETEFYGGEGHGWAELGRSEVNKPSLSALKTHYHNANLQKHNYC